MRLLITVWAVLLCVCALAQVKLADEPKLQTKLTLWVKLEPLRDVLREVSRRTGVPLRCQDAIQHEKVSIFVENRPAHEILTLLSGLLRYAWREREEGGYMLYVPDETRLQEERFLSAVRNARRQALQDLIRAAREVVEMPFHDAYRASAPQRQQANTPYEIQRAAVMRFYPMLAIRKETPTEYRFGFLPEATVLALLTNLPRGAPDALLSGKLVGFSTRPAVGVYPFPDHVLLPGNLRQPLPWREEQDETGRTYAVQPNSEVNPDYCGVWLRLNPTGNSIEYELLSFIDEQIASPYLQQPFIVLRRERGELLFQVAPYAGDQAWLKGWSAWATPLRDLRARFANQRPTVRKDRPQPNLREAVQSYGYAVTFVNGADVLEWLAWATRTPIIADAFRTDIVEVYLDELSPRHALDRLAMHGWLRMDESGYLLRRSQSYLYQRTVEIPEDALRPLERKFQAGQWLTADDYIALAARLNDAQADAYEQGCLGNRNAFSVETLHGRTVTVKFPFDTLAMNMRAWRFLATLSPVQRRQAITGAWQLAERLTLPQRTRFLQALEERFPPPESLFAEIPFPYNYSSSEAIHFTGTASFQQSTEPTPIETAAFRLRLRPETPQRLEATAGELTDYFYFNDSEFSEAETATEPNPLLQETMRQINRGLSDYERKRLLQMIEREPNLTVRQLVVYGYVLECAAPPNRRRVYFMFQSRRKPFPLAEMRKLGEPKE